MMLRAIKSKAAKITLAVSLAIFLASAPTMIAPALAGDCSTQTSCSS